MSSRACPADLLPPADTNPNLPTTPKQPDIGESLLLHAYFDHVPVVVLLDPGCDTNIISSDFLAANPSLPTAPANVDLIFGNAHTASASLCVLNRKIHAQNFTTHADFYVSPHNVPGVDIVLGNIFLKHERAYIGFHPSPHCIFPNGIIWYDTAIQVHDTDPSIQAANSHHAARFLRVAASKKEAVEAMLVALESAKPKDQDTPPAKPTGPPPNPAVVPLLDEHQDIFSRTVPDPSSQPPNVVLNPGMEIHLKPGSRPIKCRPFPLSKGEMVIVQHLVADLVNKGYVEESDPNCPWAAPMILLRKSGSRQGISNQFRIVCDFRRLNNVTDKTSMAYAPPLIRDLFRNLAGAKIFSVSDLVGGFYQSPIHPKSRDYTTFVCPTPDGPKNYRFRCVPLGLCGAPSYFQSYVDQVLSGIPGVQAYVDDFITFSATIEEHLATLKTLFTRCREHGLYLHPDKCQWGQTSITFLGFKISNNSIVPSDEKVAALRAFTAPHDQKSVRQFLGFCQYLAHLIPHFNDRAAPLSDLLNNPDKPPATASTSPKKPPRRFVLSAAALHAFESLRAALINTPGVCIPSLDAPLEVETDASAFGVGAVLYERREGVLHPLYFVSRKFNKSERNYAPRDQEALAVVFALVKFRAYLYLRPFTLYSDHQSLEKFKTQPDLQKRDWRWQEIIAEFDFNHQYRKGETMVVPDALSRSFGADPSAPATGVQDAIEADMPTQGATSITYNIPEVSHQPQPQPPAAHVFNILAATACPSPAQSLLPFTSTPNKNSVHILPSTLRVTFAQPPQHKTTSISVVSTFFDVPTSNFSPPKIATPPPPPAVTPTTPSDLAIVTPSPDTWAINRNIANTVHPHICTLFQQSDVFDTFRYDGGLLDFHLPSDSAFTSSYTPTQPRHHLTHYTFPCDGYTPVLHCNTRRAPAPANHLASSVLLSNKPCTEQLRPAPTSHVHALHSPTAAVAVGDPPVHADTRTLFVRSDAFSSNAIPPPADGSVHQSPAVPVHTLHHAPADGTVHQSPVVPVHTVHNAPFDSSISCQSSPLPRTDTCDHADGTSYHCKPDKCCPPLPPHADTFTAPARPSTAISFYSVSTPPATTTAHSITTTTSSWRTTLPPLYANDPFFGPIFTLCQLPAAELTIQQRAQVKNFSINDNNLYFNDYANDNDVCLRLCIPTSPNNTVRLQVIFDCHDGLLHQSIAKTTARLTRYYYWPTMHKDVRRYVNTCHACHTLKSNQNPKAGMLSGLPIATKRFSRVHIDFIVGLQRTPEGFDCTLVVVDSLSKFLYLIPAIATDNALTTAKRLFNTVFCIHGPPNELVSDRDTKFTAELFQHLMSCYQVHQRFTVAHDHNFNGLAEVTIRTVEVLLRHVLSNFPDRSFADFLALVAYVYNSSIHTAHPHTPYYVLFGFEPANPAMILADLPATTTIGINNVSDFVAHQQQVLQYTRDALFATQRTFNLHANRNRSEIQFQPGQLVYLSTANISSKYFARPELKFQPRYMGPFSVKEKVAPYTYRLNLPTSMRALHNVFPAALLWAQVPTDDDMVHRPADAQLISAPPTAPLPATPASTGPAMSTTVVTATDIPDINPARPPNIDPDTFVIDKVLARRRIPGPGRRRYEYLVSWEGYNSSHNSYIRRNDADTDGAAQALDDFDAKCTDD